MSKSKKAQDIRIVLAGDGTTKGTRVYAGENEISDILSMQIDLQPDSPVVVTMRVLPSSIEGLENMEGIFVTQTECE